MAAAAPCTRRCFVARQEEEEDSPSVEAFHGDGGDPSCHCERLESCHCERLEVGFEPATGALLFYLSKKNQSFSSIPNMPSTEIGSNTTSSSPSSLDNIGMLPILDTKASPGHLQRSSSSSFYTLIICIITEPSTYRILYDLNKFSLLHSSNRCFVKVVPHLHIVSWTPFLLGKHLIDKLQDYNNLKCTSGFVRHVNI